MASWNKSNDENIDQYIPFKIGAQVSLFEIYSENMPTF